MSLSINTEWKLFSRTKCEIYTRVMWYHRPVSSFNIWKKSEFYSRNYFKEQDSNLRFINKYS
jgi:hypothetical protein